ncbi:ABC transporter ATP-binding protein [Romeria aff. gracilis LEGE 07310]|uniref:ABC transporter ATP-binding protein n=1 Tax=Vasconcelosia minhoensis LEGE 07310 TaxID=915328 RepID=A0A8J7AGD7_9CYAN|nr:ABC transporter ATP-binding protein [Romeria gracilis]MBE9078374.1 ABC transporter ATP-binding protein [Romeria aff. gracilis LEGE 07310]
MIHAEGLSKQFITKGQSRLAVDSLTLHIEQGEVFGFLGPNGAGKTTTVRMLCTLIAPSAGQGWVAGYPLGSQNERIRSSIGILTETPGLYAKLSAVENLTFFARLYGVQEVSKQIEKYLSLLGLWEKRQQPVGSFSKGMRQKLAIARALLHEPPILFLDEPTGGLDPESVKVVRQFIQQLRGEGRTIFICTHNLDEADRLCDRIGILQQRLIRIDTPAGLRQSLYGNSVTVRLASVTDKILAQVRSLPFIHAVQQAEQSLTLQVEDPPQNNPELIRALVTAGADIQFVEEHQQSLETVYFNLLAQAREGSRED